MSEPILSAAPSTEKALRDEITRLNKVVTALMNRAERSASAQASDFGMFQATVMLEQQVRNRTEALEVAVRENEKINRSLQQERAEQQVLIKKLEEAHNQLLQSEKLASIGQLAAGVAHEINNPIGFVKSNLSTLEAYVGDLLRIVDAYETGQHLLLADAELHRRVQDAYEKADLAYLREDIGKLITESIDGTARVRRIVQDLLNFSRIDSSEWQWVDLHAGLESTLNVVWSELKYKVDIVREFGALPQVQCCPAELNQVFMNILLNAAQAITEHGTITLRSGYADDKVWVSITDTGKGIDPELLTKIFDPFFTTKPVGKGTGLGLSIAYGIINKHGGSISVQSKPEQGSTFTVWLPIQGRASEEVPSR
ncbi:ATP-binding protein [Rhodoferax sp.]|uniref:ATP-binding protein n=1 Tax=Rhodoferax sp. TaxID=50421 RepID=UPI00284D5970|nr:ATP-binding protein [Rhodoferax sp.]MDR3367897.1 ATP-binding protein [Rhodoferax sp.]